MLVKDKINIQRRKLGMSTAQLGEAVGVNKGSISRYENGYVKVIPVDVLHRIADVLELSFDELIREDPKYSFLDESRTKEILDQISLTAEEMELIQWYRNLKQDTKNEIKKMWIN